MKSAVALSLFWLLASVGSATLAQSSGPVRAADEPRAELRGAIAAHLAARREEVRREEAFAGRRLTAEERAQLREQLRRQWASQAAAVHTAQASQAVSAAQTAQTAESQPAERIVPGSALPRTQRH